MINISNEEIEKMDRIGSGNFGTTYLYKNKTYKIYHSHVKATNELFNIKEMIKNPSLKYDYIKYNYLKHINAKLEYTDLIDDVLYIDGKFSGIIMPYYSGDTFYDRKNDPIEKKVAMTRQLLLNAKELTNNRIYPLDYKLDNMMINGKEIKIIDLDDVKTKVLNPVYKDQSIEVLDKSIKNFFGDVDYNCLQIDELFDKKYCPVNKTYGDIENYIGEIIKRNNYIFIYENTDIDKYLNILRNPNYRVVYLYDNTYELDKKIKHLNSKNIHIYYILPINYIEDYLSSISYDELVNIKDKHIVKVKR